MFDLEFSIPIQSNLDDQSCFIDERYADGSVCIIGGLEGVSGEDRELRGITTHMNKDPPGHLGHGVDINLTKGSESRRPGDLQPATDLEVFQDVLDFLIALNPLFFGLPGDF